MKIGIFATFSNYLFYNNIILYLLILTKITNSTKLLLQRYRTIVARKKNKPKPIEIAMMDRRLKKENIC